MRCAIVKQWGINYSCVWLSTTTVKDKLSQSTAVISVNTFYSLLCNKWLKNVSSNYTSAEVLNNPVLWKVTENRAGGINGRENIVLESGEKRFTCESRFTSVISFSLQHIQCWQKRAVQWSVSADLNLSWWSTHGDISDLIISQGRRISTRLGQHAAFRSYFHKHNLADKLPARYLTDKWREKSLLYSVSTGLYPTCWYRARKPLSEWSGHRACDSFNQDPKLFRSSIHNPVEFGK